MAVSRHTANERWLIVSYRGCSGGGLLHGSRASGMRHIIWYDVALHLRQGVRDPQTSLYFCSDWDLCRAWRARSLLFKRPTESLSWYSQVAVLSRSGAKCVNSSWSLSSRSSTVASRLGGGGHLLSPLSAATVGGLLIREDCWRALESSCWNPTSSAARMMAFLRTGRIEFRYAGKQSSSTTWFSPGKQSILCTVTGYGTRHGIRMGRSGEGNVCWHVAAGHGVRNIWSDRPGRYGMVPWVPMLLLSFPP